MSASALSLLGIAGFIGIDQEQRLSPCSSLCAYPSRGLPLNRVTTVVAGSYWPFSLTSGIIREPAAELDQAMLFVRSATRSEA